MTIEENIEKCNVNIECVDEFIDFGDLESAKEYLDKAFDVIVGEVPTNLSITYIDTLMNVYRRQQTYAQLVEQRKNLW